MDDEKVYCKGADTATVAALMNANNNAIMGALENKVDKLVESLSSLVCKIDKERSMR